MSFSDLEMTDGFMRLTIAALSRCIDWRRLITTLIFLNNGFVILSLVCDVRFHYFSVILKENVKYVFQISEWVPSASIPRHKLRAIEFPKLHRTGQKTSHYTAAVTTATPI